jgi:hypothetical protein
MHDSGMIFVFDLRRDVRISVSGDFPRLDSNRLRRY